MCEIVRCVWVTSTMCQICMSSVHLQVSWTITFVNLSTRSIFKQLFLAWLRSISDFWKLFFKFLFTCLLLEKLVNKRYFSVKKNLARFLEKYFFFIIDGKHFLEVVKNLKISFYLLIITNLILKLSIAIYFVLNFFFQFHFLEFDLIWFLY